ncbi:hypothetical protein ACWEIJ_02370 [Lentzea sp. NPDC004789]
MERAALLGYPRGGSLNMTHYLVMKGSLCRSPARTVAGTVELS